MKTVCVCALTTGAVRCNLNAPWWIVSWWCEILICINADQSWCVPSASGLFLALVLTELSVHSRSGGGENHRQNSAQFLQSSKGECDPSLSSMGSEFNFRNLLIICFLSPPLPPLLSCVTSRWLATFKTQSLFSVGLMAANYRKLGSNTSWSKGLVGFAWGGGVLNHILLVCTSLKYLCSVKDKHIICLQHIDIFCLHFQLFREVRIMKLLNHPNIGELNWQTNRP